ncbi:MAG: RdgB/HAM1 family non-canonical purine NTP pyrophosphatase [Gammaproteobacteria bacterium]
MGTIVVATGNAGKLREIRAAFAGRDVELPSSGQMGIGAADEPFGTFMENALAKARYAAKKTKLPALADDSGLVVAALGGKPGVLSARYSGADATDAANNAKLLRALRMMAKKQNGNICRDAFYYAAMVFVRCADDPAPVFAEGFWRGEILASMRGDGGFGYDPLFYDPAAKKTGAQMSPFEKNRRSHRGKSLRAIIRLLIERGLL